MNICSGSAHILPTHVVRSLCAAILLLVVLALLSYLLMPSQYEDLLQSYASQGERAYVVAFIQLFLYDLISSSSIVILLVMTFIVSFLLLKSWSDGVLMGLLASITVILLALYITKNYLTNELVAGWWPVLSDKLSSGILTGLILGLAGAFGGFTKQKILSAKLGHGSDSATESSFYKCPKCGATYGSNPEFCSNCGSRLRRGSNK